MVDVVQQSIRVSTILDCIYKCGLESTTEDDSCKTQHIMHSSYDLQHGEVRINIRVNSTVGKKVVQEISEHRNI